MTMDISHALTRFELERTNEQSRKAEGLRSFMLEKINSSLSLTEILRDVVLELEKIIPDSICSIMLTGEDGKCLKLGAAPHLPDFYCQAIDGLAIARALVHVAMRLQPDNELLPKTLQLTRSGKLINH